MRNGQESRQELRAAATLRVPFTPSFLAGRFGSGLYRGHPAMELVFNNGATDRKSFTGSCNEFFLAANPVLQRRQHLCAEWLSVGPVFKQLHNRLITTEVSQGTRRKCFAEFLFHYLRVRISNTK